MYRAGWSTKIKLWSSSVSMFQSPKLFLNLILIGCCYKRMRKEGAQQPIRALLTKAVATHFSFQSMAESFGRRHNVLQLTHSISIYRCLWWVNHRKHEQTGLERGDGMEISTQVQSRRRRWLKTSRQLTMKHRLRHSWRKCQHTVKIATECFTRSKICRFQHCFGSETEEQCAGRYCFWQGRASHWLQICGYQTIDWFCANFTVPHMQATSGSEQSPVTLTCQRTQNESGLKTCIYLPVQRQICFVYLKEMWQSLWGQQKVSPSHVIYWEASYRCKALPGKHEHASTPPQAELEESQKTDWKGNKVSS